MLFRSQLAAASGHRRLQLRDVREIAVQQIAKLQATMTRSGRELVVTSEALDQLVQDGYSLAFGARFLKRVIDERVKLPISQRWAEGTHFVARAKEGIVTIEVSTGKGRLTLAASA